MSPSQFLLLTVALTAVAAAIQLAVRRRHVRRLRRLAAEWKMHFIAADRFKLAPRVAEWLPVPGAAGVRVFDLIYGIERENYRYVFATEYTVGVLRTKTGWRRVATFSEPRDASAGGTRSELVFAPPNLPLIEQYQHLRTQTTSAEPRP